jgi:hypothetical protein
MKALCQQTRYMRFERDAYYTGLLGQEAPIRKFGLPGIGGVLARFLLPEPDRIVLQIEPRAQKTRRKAGFSVFGSGGRI